MRAELSAWRYGREFLTRRRRTLAVGTVSVSAALANGAGSALLSALAIGAPAMIGIGLIGFVSYAAFDGARVIEIAHDNKRLKLYRADLNRTYLEPIDDAYGAALHLRHSYGHLVMTGDEAQRILSRLFTRVNGIGATQYDLDYAVERLGSADTLRDLMHGVAERSGAVAERFEQQMHALRTRKDPIVLSNSGFDGANPGALRNIGFLDRLAFEMALHEESERRAMEGELAPLLAAWRDAELIAGIADALLVSPVVDDRLRRLKARGQ